MFVLYTTPNSVNKTTAPKIFFAVVLTAVITLGLSMYGKQLIPGGVVKGISVISPVGTTETNTEQQVPVSTGIPSITPVVPSPTHAPNHSVDFQYISSDFQEGGYATFTWNVSGTPEKIQTTSVYLGTESFAGISPDAFPSKTPYSLFIKDFMNGSYDIPLQFTGSVKIDTPGIYYARAYARIGQRHVWSPERSLRVNALPKYEVKVVNYQQKVAKGANASFTWEVSGPASKTEFTTIAIGKLSKPGPLDGSVDIPHTPYAVLVRDFTNGIFDVPLRFIGNGIITEPGEYYFRALAFVNGKNIWSDEQTITVE